MEKEKSSIVTFEDLVKYTEEVLFPEFEEMMDEKLKPINQELVNIRAELSDIKSEISAIRNDIKYVKNRLDSLEKMTKEDLAVLAPEIDQLKQANKEITRRITFLENKTA